MPQPNFPDSPTVNQEYTYSGSTWVWTGQYWRVQQAPSTNNNFIPSANVAYDLGAADLRWRDLYLAGNTVYLGAATLSSSGSAIALPAGSTVGGQSVASTGEVTSGSSPKITAIAVTDNAYTVLDDTAVDITGGYIKITGTGFITGCQVLINNIPATSTTFVSATEVRAQVSATTAGTYIVYLVNPDGGVAIRVNGITFSATPAWVTGSALAGNVDEAISIQLSATGATSYVLESGSTLPTGLTLTSGGLLSGTITGLVNDTSYSFTITAIDAENQDSPRSFTITISTNLQVARSLRFNSADSAYLSRTPAVAGSRTTWTWSAWVKRGGLYTTNAGPTLFDAGPNNSNFAFVRFLSDNQDKLDFGWTVSNSTAALVRSNAFYRDPSAWYHIVAVLDTTNATTSDRMRLYVNGQQITSFVTTTYPAQNTATCHINATNVHYLGRSVEPSYRYMDDYMTEVNFVDGQALTPSSFAKTDPITGQWIPKRYTGTYGTNGFYLNFSDNSNTTATTLGKDTSGNNNNWTPTNFSVTAGTGNDSMVDSPTSYGTDTGLGGEVRGNYCTINALMQNTSVATISDGSLKAVTGTSGVSSAYTGTIGFSSGKWYWEVYVGAVGSNNMWIGVTKNQAYRTVDAYTNTWTYNKLGQKTDNAATGSAYGAAYTTGDTIGVAVDADAGSITFYKNGVSQGVAFSGLTMSGGVYTIGGSDNSATMIFNYGQRAFAYAAPSGFKCLNTHNLPTPNVVVSNTAFNTLLYTGDGASSKTIAELAFQPDLVWIKSRSNASGFHILADSVRGAGNWLATNSTNAEAGPNQLIAAFNTDGFSLNLSPNNTVNESGGSYVAWAWDAGTATAVNTAGSISANVRVNTAAGFSIVSWTGTGANATVGHGLNAVPQFIIVRNRDTVYNWRVWHKALSGTQVLYLNTTDSTVTDATMWNSTTPTSSVFSLGTNGGVNESTKKIIAYCFAEVPGYNAFGSYTGNGSADGPFVYLGFRPRFIMIKSTGVESWGMWDSVRNSYNFADDFLLAQSSNAEQNGPQGADILSNGFKIRGNYAINNTSSQVYIYAAFAESPFKYARAR